MADQDRRWMLSPEEADDRFMNPFLPDHDRKVRIDMYEYVAKGAGSYLKPGYPAAGAPE